jgi:hypothetical protein
MSASLSQDRELFDPPEGATDDEAWAWAQRVIREVTGEATSEERKARDFLRTWVRWSEMVGFLNFADLHVMKRGTMTARERQWHETLAAALISLGGMLRDWAVHFDEQILELAGYSTSDLNTMLESLRQSMDLWHGLRSEARIRGIQALLAHD